MFEEGCSITAKAANSAVGAVLAHRTPSRDLGVWFRAVADTDRYCKSVNAQLSTGPGDITDKCHSNSNTSPLLLVMLLVVWENLHSFP